LSLSQAALWGVILFFSLFDPDFEPVTSLILIALGGISSGAMTALLPRFWLAVTNISLLLLPSVFLSLFILRDYSMAVLILTFYSYLIALGKRSYGEYMRAFDIEMQLEAQHAELEQLNKIDPLTQIYNRGYFNTAFEINWNSSVRNLNKLSLLLIDIDHFKQVNDTHGHLIGDECLVYIAQVIHETAKRKTDVIARFGGEEFAILLNKTTVDDACVIAESIRHRIASTPFQSNEIRLNITASIGVASVQPDTNLNSNQLIEMADKALYQAKSEGRNRVLCSNEKKVVKSPC